MGSTSFDDFSKTIASQSSRRGVLQAVGALLLGAVLSRTTRAEAGTACTPPSSLCGTVCVDTSSDLNNCSACGVVCGDPNSTCSAGVCVQTATSVFVSSTVISAQLQPVQPTGPAPCSGCVPNSSSICLSGDAGCLFQSCLSGYQQCGDPLHVTCEVICCPLGGSACGGVCCKLNEKCFVDGVTGKSGCCQQNSGALCNGACCPSGQCCTQSGTCVSSCPSGQSCQGGVCRCSTFFCNGVCCPSGQLCYYDRNPSGTCCDKGTHIAPDLSCCTNGLVVCGNTCGIPCPTDFSGCCTLSQFCGRLGCSIA